MMVLKKIKHKVLNWHGALDKPVINIDSEEANRLISLTLLDDKPAMIARLGAFEVGVAKSIATPFNIQNIYKLLKGEITKVGYDKRLAKSLCNNAGFFPNERRQIELFGKLLIADMPFCDVLGSWQPAERFFRSQLENCHKVALIDLEPFHHVDPWTKSLAGKKILVIHPYRDSILHQWEVRDRLFPTRDYLPDFDLKVIKAVQSAAGTKNNFATWFDALDYMKKKIDETDFDIALIGCGAYGFHLAAHVKRIGKKSVHLGGVLQILFGIMGKRWDGKYPFINEYWIRPLPSDTIQNANSIENGCYW